MTWTWHRTLLAQITVQALIAAYIAVTTSWGGALAGRKGEGYALYAEDDFVHAVWSCAEQL